MQVAHRKSPLDLALAHLKALAELTLRALMPTFKFRRRRRTEGVELTTIRKGPTQLSVLPKRNGTVDVLDANHHNAAPSPFGNRVAPPGRGPPPADLKREPGVCGNAGEGAENGSREHTSDAAPPPEAVPAVGPDPLSGSGSEADHISSFDPERAFFTTLANTKLKGDAALRGVLPVQPESDGILEASRDGVLPCKLLGALLPDAIDERAVNVGLDGSELQEREMLENHALCMSCVKALGSAAVDLKPDELVR